MNASSSMNRRTLLSALAATVLGSRIDAVWADTIITRPIPSTGEKLPAVGLGSWITFMSAMSDPPRPAWARRRLNTERGELLRPELLLPWLSTKKAFG